MHESAFIYATFLSTLNCEAYATYHIDHSDKLYYVKIKTFSVNHYNRMGWGTKISRADHYFRKNWSGGNKIFNEKIGPQDHNYRDQNSSDSDPTVVYSPL